jgi:hypothetical protein
LGLPCREEIAAAVVGKKEKEKPGSLRLPGFEVGGWIGSQVRTLCDPQTLHAKYDINFLFINLLSTTHFVFRPRNLSAVAQTV